VIDADPKRVPEFGDVKANAAKFVRMMFGTGRGQSVMGRMNVERRGNRFGIMVEIEGVNVHDPDVQRAVKRQIETRFVALGFGPRGRLVVQQQSLLAGSAEDGKPAAQLLVLPDLQSLLSGE
jgi:hypothetical protein